MIGQWTLYQSLYTGIITPLLAQLQGMIGQVLAVVHPAALALVAFWLALIGIDVALGHKSIPNLVRDFLLAALFIGLLQTTGVYNQYVSDLFIQIIPNSLAPAFGGQQSPAAGMDHVLNTALKSALTTYEALPSYSFKALPLAMLIVVFAILAFVATGYAFAIFAVATITVVICIFVGPIFIGLAAIPNTRWLAKGWLSATIAAIATQLLSLAVMLLLTTTENAALNVTAATIPVGDNSIKMLVSLGQCGILIFLCTIVIKQIPDLSRAIAGGVYHNTSAVGQWTFGMGVAAGALIAKGARGAAGAMGSLANRQIGSGAVKSMRPTAPAGASLSNKKEGT
jgi:type IV secretory pathway VirB6-like protein